MNKLFFVLFCLTVMGCSISAPVKGQLQSSKEKFTGVATGYLDGSGKLNIVSTEGRVCEGSFVYVTRRQGEGVFNCDDGDSGSFTFASTGTRGTGTGNIGGDKFIFTFGN